MGFPADVFSELQLLKRAVEDAHEAVIITDAVLDRPGPRIQFVNPAFTAMTGYTKEEALGRTPRILQGPDTDREVLDAVRRHLHAGEPVQQQEILNYRKDGTPYWVEWTISPVCSDDGTVSHWVSVQRDITERKQRREELERERDLLSQTQRLAGGWRIDLQTGEVACTEETLRIHGLPPEETLNPEIGFSFYPERVRPLIRAAFERCCTDGTPYDLILPFRTTDGAERWVRTTGTAMRENGTIVRVVGALQDITDAYTYRRRLERERQRLEMALRGGNLGLWDLNFVTGENTVNDYWAHMLGYAPEDVEPTYEFFRDRVHPEDWSVLRKATLRHIRGEDPIIDAEIRMQAADGSWRWILDRGKIVEWTEEGRPRRAVGTHMDVTDRKEAEQALWQSRERFRAVSEQAVDVIAIFDASGTFVYLSPSVESVTGISRDVLHGRDGFERIHPDDRPRVQAAFQAAVESSGETVETQGRIRHRDGSWRHLSIRGRRIAGHHGAARVLANIRDTTDDEQRRAALIRAKENAEEANRLKSAMLANMSHEVRTPLTSIIGFSEILASMDLGGEAQQFVQRIEAGGKRLLDTLNAVLNLSQLESGSVSLNMESVWLPGLVRACVDGLQGTRKAHAVDVQMDTSGNLRIHSDRIVLDGVFTNVLSNAVKFTPDGGRVTITLTGRDDGVTARIEDTGVGIDPDFLPNIFDAFTQESSGNAREFEGSGLGLAITKKYLDQVGGTIQIESVKGEGTCVTITLPRSVRPRSHPPSATVLSNSQNVDRG